MVAWLTPNQLISVRIGASVPKKIQSGVALREEFMYISDAGLDEVDR